MGISPRLLPVDLEAQLISGSFAHAVHHVVEALDLSLFDAHCSNDDDGASVHAPAMPLHSVCWRIRKGMLSSRTIKRACRDNVLFIGLTEFLAPAQKMERAAKAMLDRHCANEAGSVGEGLDAKTAARIRSMTCEAAL